MTDTIPASLPVSALTGRPWPPGQFGKVEKYIEYMNYWGLWGGKDYAYEKIFERYRDGATPDECIEALTDATNARYAEANVETWKRGVTIRSTGKTWVQSMDILNTETIGMFKSDLLTKITPPIDVGEFMQVTDAMKESPEFAEEMSKALNTALNNGVDPGTLKYTMNHTSGKSKLHLTSCRYAGKGDYITASNNKRDIIRSAEKFSTMTICKVCLA